MAWVRIKSMCLCKGSFVKYFSAKATVRRRNCWNQSWLPQNGGLSIKAAQHGGTGWTQKGMCGLSVVKLQHCQSKDMFEKLCLWQRQICVERNQKKYGPVNCNKWIRVGRWGEDLPCTCKIYKTTNSGPYYWYCLIK